MIEVDQGKLLEEQEEKMRVSVDGPTMLVSLSFVVVVE